MKISTFAEQSAPSVYGHLDLRERRYPENLAACGTDDFARGKIDVDLRAAPQAGGEEVARQDGQSGVDGVALVDRAEGAGDNGPDAQALETVDGLLAGRTGPEVRGRDDDIAGGRFRGEVLPARQVVERVAAHQGDVGDGQIAVVKDHVGVNVVFVDDPNPAPDDGRLRPGVGGFRRGG